VEELKMAVFWVAAPLQWFTNALVAPAASIISAIIVLIFDEYSRCGYFKLYVVRAYDF
jgi:hypothetical protein